MQSNFTICKQGAQNAPCMTLSLLLHASHASQIWRCTSQIFLRCCSCFFFLVANKVLLCVVSFLVCDGTLLTLSLAVLHAWQPLRAVCARHVPMTLSLQALQDLRTYIQNPKDKDVVMVWRTFFNAASAARAVGESAGCCRKTVRAAWKQGWL